MSEQIKAIETTYKGYRFRSRLEARWAVFFDALGVPYSYEPQGFDLGEAGFYLPDFWLPQQKWWVEIKPGAPNAEDEAKILAFAEHYRIAVFIGDVPTPTGVTDWDGGWYSDQRITIYSPFEEDGILVAAGDNAYRWCACRTGQHFDIQYEGRGDRIDCGCPGFIQGGRGHSGDNPSILRAYAAARYARFEHGQTPR